MQLVDLADEYHLTTSEALDLCTAAGIEADSSATELDAEQAAHFRRLAEERRARQAAMEADAHAAEAAEIAADAEQLAMADFGPIPPAPWEETDGEPVSAPEPDRDPLGPHDPRDPAAAWYAVATTVETRVSLAATAALAFAVIALVFPFVTALVALALGALARKQIADAGGRLTGERLATLAQVVASLGIVLWLAILGTAVYSDWKSANTPVRYDPQTDTGEIAWDAIARGDCVRVPRADVAVKHWQGVSCDDPHEGEIILVDRIDHAPGAPFPGKASLLPFIERECRRAFEEYVGVPFDRSELRLGGFYPAPSNWTAVDDRLMGCVVYQQNHLLITGRLESSRR